MKKILFVLTALFVCGLAVMSCASDKKSKKNPLNSITVEVTPSFLGEIIASSPTRTLTAVVRNNGAVVTNAPVNWVVNPSTGLGTCSPNPASQTVFTANMSASGQGTIVASYNGVNSAPVQFSINEAPIVIDSVMITPSSPQSITSTDTITFTASVMSATNTYTGSAYQINWTATGGSISPNPSDSGAAVTFTPSISSGTATVKASYGTVDSSVVNIVVGSTEPPITERKVLVENGAFAVGSNLNDMWWWRNQGQTYLGIGIVSDVGYDNRTRNLYRYDFKNLPNNWDGLQFAGTHTNYSDYNKLVFYAKGVSSSDTKFVARFVNTDGAHNEGIFTINNMTWTKCEIPLSINRTSVATPFVAVFVQNPSGEDNPNIAITPPSQVMIDYVYLEK